MPQGKVQYCLLNRKQREDNKDNNKDVKLIYRGNSEEIFNLEIKLKRKICLKVLIQDLRDDMNKSWDMKKRTSRDLMKPRKKSTGKSKRWRTDLTIHSTMKSNKYKWLDNWLMMRQEKVKDQHLLVETNI